MEPWAPYTRLGPVNGRRKRSPKNRRAFPAPWRVERLFALGQSSSECPVRKRPAHGSELFWPQNRVRALSFRDPVDLGATGSSDKAQSYWPLRGNEVAGPSHRIQALIPRSRPISFVPLPAVSCTTYLRRLGRLRWVCRPQASEMLNPPNTCLPLIPPSGHYYQRAARASEHDITLIHVMPEGWLRGA